MQEAIKIAIENGYIPKTYCIENPNQDERDIYTALPATYILDHLFWKALGKGLGWEENRDLSSRYVYTEDSESGEAENSTSYFKDTYLYYMHHFIDHLSEGKDIDSFFTNLINK